MGETKISLSGILHLAYLLYMYHIGNLGKLLMDFLKQGHRQHLCQICITCIPEQTTRLKIALSCSSISQYFQYCCCKDLQSPSHSDSSVDCIFFCLFYAKLVISVRTPHSPFHSTINHKRFSFVFTIPTRLDGLFCVILISGHVIFFEISSDCCCTCPFLLSVYGIFGITLDQPVIVLL